MIVARFLVARPPLPAWLLLEGGKASGPAPAFGEKQKAAEAALEVVVRATLRARL
jgi:hypothetical protein